MTKLSRIFINKEAVQQSASEDDYFFPAFMGESEMGEYGDGFTKVEKSVLEIITLARNNEKNVIYKGLSIAAGFFECVTGYKQYREGRA